MKQHFVPIVVSIFIHLNLVLALLLCTLANPGEKTLLTFNFQLPDEADEPMLIVPEIPIEISLEVPDEIESESRFLPTVETVAPVMSEIGIGIEGIGGSGQPENKSHADAQEYAARDVIVISGIVTHAIDATMKNPWERLDKDRSDFRRDFSAEVFELDEARFYSITFFPLEASATDFCSEAIASKLRAVVNWSNEYARRTADSQGTPYSSELVLILHSGKIPIGQLRDLIALKSREIPMQIVCLKYSVGADDQIKSLAGNAGGQYFASRK